MRTILAILIAVLLLAGVAYAAEVAAPLTGTTPANPGLQQPAYQASATQRVTVQRVARKDGLRPGDQPVIDQYLASYKAKLSKENYNCLVEALPVEVGNGDIDARDCNGKLILNQIPQHYLDKRQDYGAVVTGTDWYANIPMLPAFNPPASQGKLGFKPACLGEAKPEQPARPRAEGFPAQSWSQGRVGPSQLNTTNWALGYAKEQKAPKQICPPKPPPVHPPICPPGNPPPEQNPSGCNVLPTDGGSNIHVPNIPRPPSSR